MQVCGKGYMNILALKNACAGSEGAPGGTG